MPPRSASSGSGSSPSSTTPCSPGSATPAGGPSSKGSAYSSVSSPGSSAGGFRSGAGASTYGAGSPMSSGRNATVGGTKRARDASHSDSATMMNATDISRTITGDLNLATPAITATTTMRADSAASRSTTPGIAGRADSYVRVAQGG